ncbi:hypothetical protein M5D96_011329 [Drosophila gunungcola]|uniref:Uncharacterized protein n=1 Tax=Drosophila gunungcola TaxID=103775 RepID=A0A9P9YF97_9MUSC|nr:hypothetical protein M5D96_011329 [Drosophila gunungcola]
MSIASKGSNKAKSNPNISVPEIGLGKDSILENSLLGNPSIPKKVGSETPGNEPSKTNILTLPASFVPTITKPKVPNQNPSNPETRIQKPNDSRHTTMRPKIQGAGKVGSETLGNGAATGGEVKPIITKPESSNQIPVNPETLKPPVAGNATKHITIPEAGSGNRSVFFPSTDKTAGAVKPIITKPESSNRILNNPETLIPPVSRVDWSSVGVVNSNISTSEAPNQIKINPETSIPTVSGSEIKSPTVPGAGSVGSEAHGNSPSSNHILTPPVSGNATKHITIPEAGSGKTLVDLPITNQAVSGNATKSPAIPGAGSVGTKTPGNASSSNNILTQPASGVNPNITNSEVPNHINNNPETSIPSVSGNAPKSSAIPGAGSVGSEIPGNAPSSNNILTQTAGSVYPTITKSEASNQISSNPETLISNVSGNKAIRPEIPGAVKVGSAANATNILTPPAGAVMPIITKPEALNQIPNNPETLIPPVTGNATKHLTILEAGTAKNKTPEKSPNTNNILILPAGGVTKPEATTQINPKISIPPVPGNATKNIIVSGAVSVGSEIPRNTPSTKNILPSDSLLTTIAPVGVLFKVDEQSCVSGKLSETKCQKKSPSEVWIDQPNPTPVPLLKDLILTTGPPNPAKNNPKISIVKDSQKPISVDSSDLKDFDINSLYPKEIDIKKPTVPSALKSLSQLILITLKILISTAYIQKKLISTVFIQKMLISRNQQFHRNLPKIFPKSLFQKALKSLSQLILITLKILISTSFIQKKLIATVFIQKMLISRNQQFHR